MRKTGLFDPEKHFAFHGTYHSNPINIAIRMLFVWPIFFTALLILYFTPSIFDVELSLFSSDVVLAFNIGFLLTLIYSVFYFFLDSKAGSLAALLCFICGVGSNFLGSRLGFSLAWKVVLVAQIVCWTGQFIGHGGFEKRAPALLENLAQAFIMAPFFVLLEVIMVHFNLWGAHVYDNLDFTTALLLLQALQSIFGYELYPGFHARVQARVDADITAWKENKQRLVS